VRGLAAQLSRPARRMRRRASVLCACACACSCLVTVSAYDVVGGAAAARASLSPPLIVTVGPQCSGKTTLIRAGWTGGKGGSSSASTIMDVCLDDHPDTYHAVPVQYLLGLEVMPKEDDVIIQSQSISERLRSAEAQMQALLVRRLMGSMGSEAYRDAMQDLCSSDSPSDMDDWVLAVEAAIDEGQAELRTKAVDLFIPEGIFPSAVKGCQRQLQNACKSHAGPVAWGNTNTKARDFCFALECAHLSERPVVFWRWGQELPSLSLRELFRRNVERFSRTGRLIPPGVIAQALRRTELLLERTNGGDAACLAKAAGYTISPLGLVIPESPKISSRGKTKTDQKRGRRGLGAPVPPPANEWRGAVPTLQADGSILLSVEEPFSTVGGRISAHVLQAAENAAIETEKVVLQGLVLMGKEWQRFRRWKSDCWKVEREALEPAMFRYGVPGNGTSDGEDKDKSALDRRALEFDTVDLVKVIRGDKRPRF
jgi:hypothetical protein